MKTRVQLSPLEVEFHQLVSSPKSKPKDVTDFVARHPELNVNCTDPVSNRTALHLVLNQAMFDTLVGLGCEQNQLDKGGFTAFDLLLSPYEYAGIFNDIHYISQIRYYQFFIMKANAKFIEKKLVNVSLIYVNRIEEINKIISQNPTLTKIGFILKRPNCLRDMGYYGDNVIRDFHLSPIYFERTKTQEVFIQFDSILGTFYSLPVSTEKSRVQYYSPFHRQPTVNGCFEDAITLLTKLLKLNNFNVIQFCAANSNRDSAVQQSLSKKERDEYKQLQEKYLLNNLKDEDQNALPPLRRRYDHEKLVKLYKHNDLNPIKQIFQLTALPPLLLLHVNFYRTMRTLRISAPELFAAKLDPTKPNTVLDTILKQGTIRAKNMSIKEIKKHVSSASEYYDFKSRDFTAREEVFKTCYLSYDRMVYTLFYHKFAGIEAKHAGKLARKVAEFVTGAEDSVEAQPAVIPAQAGIHSLKP